MKETSSVEVDEKEVERKRIALNSLVRPGILRLSIFYFQIPLVRILGMNDGKSLISRVQEVIRSQNMQITFSHPRNLDGNGGKKEREMK